MVEYHTTLPITAGVIKGWGLRAFFLSNYTELDAGQNACITIKPNIYNTYYRQYL